jgi:iron complex outermembrane receptor protein
MTVIGAERIRTSTARTLPELLGQEAGIVVRDNTGSPDWQVDLRGFGAAADQNTLVLVDGQPLNEIELVPVRWSSIPLDSIERIEILRGSGAVLYGAGASGGAINIITRSPRAGERSATVGAAAGTYRTRELRAGMKAAAAPLGLSLSANDYRSDNYRENNRLEQQNIVGEARAFGAWGHAGVRLGLENQNLQLPGARTEAQLQTDRRGASTPRDFAARDGARASLFASFNVGEAELAAELGWRDSVRTASLKDYFFGGLFDIYTDTRTDVWTFSPRLRLPYRLLGWRHSLVAGFDGDDWDYESRRAASLETLGTPNAHIFAAQRNQAVYVQHNSELSEATKLTLGARKQRVTMSARDSVNPAAYAAGEKVSTPHAWEVGLRHALTPAWAVHGKVGRSFRVATVDESYSQFGGPLFDAIVTLLEPQTSRQHELGVEHRDGSWRARASAYHYALQNEIHFFAPTFSNINLPPTLRRGLEIDVSFAASARLTLFANASAVQARFREGTIGGVDVSGKTIPLVPRRSANTGLTWQPANRTTVSAVARYVGEQRYDNDQANTFGSLMPAYWTADVQIAREIGKFFLRFALNNAFDRRYYSYAIRNAAGTSFNAYPQRERNVLLSAEYRM